MICIKSDSLTIINEDFTKFFLFSTTSFGKSFELPQSSVPGSSEIYSPVATRDRGVYFFRTSSIVSNQLIVPAPDLTISLIIRLLSPGKILQVFVDSQVVLSMECDLNSMNTNLVYEREGIEKNILISTPVVIGKWNKVVVWISQTNAGLIAKLQGSEIYVDLGEFRYQSASTEWKLGSSGQSFEGFLAKISCINEVISIPSEIFMYNTCDVNEDYNPILGECTKSNCAGVDWSISKICIINDLENCIESVGFTEDLCKKCSNGAENGKCGCGFRCISCINDDPYQCNICEAGLYPHGGLCIYPCFNCNSTSLFSTYEFSFKNFLPKVFHGFYSGKQATSFQPFNNPESDDPIPSAYRGYYFNGGHFLRSEVFHISTRGAFAIWTKPENDGCIWCSQFLQIYSSLRLGAIFSNRAISLFYFSGEITMLESWSFITVSIDYSLDPAITTIISSVNNAISRRISENLLLYDISGVVGIGYNPKTTEEYFKGFLYYIKYWWGEVPQNFVEESQIFIPSPKNSCNFSEFYNIELNKCSDCHFTCEHGCHTFASCSFCTLLDCDFCSGFEDQECKKISSTCIDATLINHERTTCCSINCNSDCTGPNPCDCVDINYHDKVSIDACCYSECPSGFISKGSKCIQSNSQIMNFNFGNHQEKKWQDVNGNTIYNINTSSFVQRGFYYYEAMAFISAIVLSHKFTIQLWIKQITPGEILRIDELSIISYDKQTLVITSKEFFQFGALVQSWCVLIIKQNESPLDNYISLQYYPSPASYFIKVDFCEFYSGGISLSHLSQGFEGFIWKLAIYNDYVELFEDLNVCNEYMTIECLWDCDPWQYWSSKACIPCSYSNIIDSEVSTCISHNTRRATPSYTIDSCTYSSCPAGYSLVATTCSMIDKIVLDFSFNVISTTSFNDAYGNTLNVHTSIPSPVRGYYFKSTTSANISSILLSYTFSIYLWIKQIHPGAILTFDTLSLESTSSQTSLLIDSYTYPGSSYTSSWSIIIVQRYILLGSNYIGIQTYPDSSILTYTDPTSCEFLNGVIVLGTSPTASPGFTGFIWTLSFYNGAYTADTSLIVCSTTVLSACIWDCNISQYLDITGVCSACLGSCQSCRNSYDCNLCVSSICTSCSDYYTCNSCVSKATLANNVCQCNEFYYESLTLTGGTECRESGICISGDSRYTVDQCCFSVCPNGYTLSSECTLTSETAMDFLYDNLIETIAYDLYGNSMMIGSPPYPYIQRGYYYASNCFSCVQNLIVVSHSISLHMWIKLYIPGSMFSIDNLKITSSYTGYTVQIGEIVYAFGTILINQWTVLIMKRWTDSNMIGYISLGLYPGSQLQVIEPVACNFLVGSFFIGFSFEAFVWRFSLYNTIQDIPIDLETCSPTILSNCLWDCDIYYFFSNGICVPCVSGCSSCRNSNDCNVCVNSLCSGCDYYSTCTTCVVGSELVNGICQCSAGYYFDPTAQTCSACYQSCSVCYGPTLNECSCGDNSYFDGDECQCTAGFTMVDSVCLACDYRCLTCSGDTYYACQSCSAYLLETVCLPLCPVGYIVVENRCVQEIIGSLALKFSFNSLQTVFHDEIYGLTALSAGNNSYSDLVSSDPIPAYQRGIYFTGNISCLSLPHSDKDILLLGIRFFIAIWVNPYSSNCTFLQYQDADGNTVLSMNLAYLYVTGMIKVDLQSYNYSSITPLQPSQWNHILLALTYAKYASLQVYINSCPTQSLFLSSAPFIDNINNVLTIGADRYLSEHFKGFVYAFELYLSMPDIQQLVSISKCDNCFACLPSKECIVNCDISEFYDESMLQCVNCNRNCTSGCRNSDSCNLCLDPNCISCSSYDINSCIECEINYEVQNHTCLLCNSSTFYDAQLQSCQVCLSPCKECSALNECLTCEINSHLNSTACECDLGYSLNDTSCSRNTFSVLTSVSSDYIITTYFTEDLESILVNSDIKLSYNEIIQDFWLQQLSNSSYTISVTFNTDITTSHQLILMFAKDIVSIKNSILATTEILINVSTSYVNSTASQIVFAKTASQTALVASVCIIFGSSLVNSQITTLFHFLNNLEMYTYSSLYQNNLDEVLTVFLQQLSPNPKKPNAFSYFIDMGQHKAPNSTFKYFDFNTNLILLNSGSTLSILTAIIVIYLFALLLRNFKGALVSKLVGKLISSFRFRVFLRFFVQSFLELSYTSAIGILYSPLETPIEIADFLVCVLIAVMIM